MIPAVHRFSARGKNDSPAEHPTLPSRLHNFNFKSWGTQRHLRTRKPTTNTEPTSMSPWNLRAKRADQGEEKRGEVTCEVVTSPIEEKFVERRVFCVTLLREEIEEDVYALKGTRPTRRPRKRPRGVQHQIDVNQNKLMASTTIEYGIRTRVIGLEFQFRRGRVSHADRVPIARLH